MRNFGNAGHFNEFRSDLSFGALVSVPIAQRQAHRNIDFENGPENVARRF